MAKLTKKQVQETARLARLQIDKKEVKTFQIQLSRVLDYISELEEVDTQGAKGKARNTKQTNIYREDDKNPGVNTLSQKQALSGSKEDNNQFFVVPMILTEKKNS